MDLNTVVLAGRLACTPERREFDNGTTMTRLLVVVRTEQPRKRSDVVPVTCWDMDLPDFQPGDRVRVAGAVQRRFWSDERSGRTSRIEVVANDVTRQTVKEDADQ